MNEITEQSDKKTIRKQLLIDINKHLIKYELINEKNDKQIKFLDDNKYDWYITKHTLINSDYCEYVITTFCKIGQKELYTHSYLQFNKQGILVFQNNPNIKFRKSLNNIKFFFI